MKLLLIALALALPATTSCKATDLESVTQSIAIVTAMAAETAVTVSQLEDEVSSDEGITGEGKLADILAAAAAAAGTVAASVAATNRVRDGKRKARSEPV